MAFFPRGAETSSSLLPLTHSLSSFFSLTSIHAYTSFFHPFLPPRNPCKDWREAPLYRPMHTSYDEFHSPWQVYFYIYILEKKKLITAIIIIVVIHWERTSTPPFSMHGPLFRPLLFLWVKKALYFFNCLSFILFYFIFFNLLSVYNNKVFTIFFFF